MTLQTWQVYVLVTVGCLVYGIIGGIVGRVVYQVYSPREGTQTEKETAIIAAMACAVWPVLVAAVGLYRGWMAWLRSGARPE